MDYTKEKLMRGNDDAGVVAINLIMVLGKGKGVRSTHAREISNGKW